MPILFSEKELNGFYLSVANVFVHNYTCTHTRLRWLLIEDRLRPSKCVVFIMTQPSSHPLFHLTRIILKPALGCTSNVYMDGPLWGLFLSLCVSSGFSREFWISGKVALLSNFYLLSNYTVTAVYVFSPTISFSCRCVIPNEKALAKGQTVPVNPSKAPARCLKFPGRLSERFQRNSEACLGLAWTSMWDMI